MFEVQLMCGKLQYLDGRPMSTDELHARVKAYYETHDERGYPRKPADPLATLTVAERTLLTLMEPGKSYPRPARPGIRRHMLTLRNHGLVERTGHGASTRYRLAGIQEGAK